MDDKETFLEQIIWTNMHSSERLQKLIKKLRGERSQRQFAKVLGVSYASLRTWEEGESAPLLPNLEKIAKYINQPIEELLNYLNGDSDLDKIGVPKQLSVEEVFALAQGLSREEKGKLMHLLVSDLTQ